MTKLGFFGAAAVILSSALASPVMAQQVITDPGYCAQFYPNANCENNGPDNPYTGDYQLRNGWGSNTNWNNGWHDSWNDDPWDRHYAAPFRGDSYASYDNGYRGGYNDTYADTYARSWFVCQPGSYFRGEDGRRHICQ
jgi:hypothetical protein